MMVLVSTIVLIALASTLKEIGLNLKMWWSVSSTSEELENIMIALTCYYNYIIHCLYCGLKGPTQCKNEHGKDMERT